MKPFSILLISSALALGNSQTAVADSQLVDDSPHFGETGWEVNAGVLFSSTSDNPTVYESEEDDFERFVGLVRISYFGERFYVKSGPTPLLGYTLTQDQNSAIDAILSPRFGGVSNDNDLLEDADLDERDRDLHAGLRYSKYFDSGLIRLDVSTDISDTHDGYTLSAGYLHEWQVRNWLVTGSASVGYMSENMADYYFGIDRDEATGQFPAYQADGAIIPAFRLSAEYPLNENWTFNTHLRYFMLIGDLEDSPITIDDDELVAISASVWYHF